jgi:hypothetical protein
MKHKAKFGLNSGNSFHFGTRLRSLRGASVKNQNVIVKTFLRPGYATRQWPYVTLPPQGSNERVRVEHEIARTMWDGDLCFNEFQDLHLSLNKHKRWLLAEIISDCIDELRCAESDVDSRLTGTEQIQPNEYFRQHLTHSRRQHDENREDNGLIRVTMSRRLIASSPGRSDYQVRSYRQGVRTLDHDCIEYEDSAVPSVIAREANRRIRYSFNSDLRHAALARGTNTQIGDCEAVEAFVEGRVVPAKRPPRTNTRGVQRLKTTKDKRSKTNDDAYWR